MFSVDSHSLWSSLALLDLLLDLGCFAREGLGVVGVQQPAGLLSACSDDFVAVCVSSRCNRDTHAQRESAQRQRARAAFINPLRMKCLVCRSQGHLM